MRELAYLFGIFFVALAVYAVEMTNRNNDLQQTVHAHYTNELVNTSETMSELSRAILKVQLLDEGAVSDEARQEVWRLSSELRNATTKVPLDADLTNRFMQYFAKIGEQSTNPSSDWRSISQNMKLIEEEWRVATATFLNNESSYHSWQQQIEGANPDFQMLATSMKQYQEADFPLTASESDYEKKIELSHLVDKEVTKRQAIDVVKQRFPHLEDATFTVSLNGEDAAYPFYHIQFVRGSRLGYADVTKKGGHILSFLLERPVKEKQLSQQEARTSAESFLQRAGYEDVVFTEVRENHEAWHFVYSRKAGEAIVYPDSIQLKVAKDEGEILGVNAMEYIQKETLPETAFLPIQLEDILAENVHFEPIKKIYTENDAFEIVPCYEVIATQYDETFRVILDAQTHKVLQMEHLT